MAGPDISVVIPAFRAVETIGRTIQSCLAEVAPANIIAVLDGADDDLERQARACHPDVQVIVMAEKPGAPACRNHGLSLCETGAVIFLDADDYVEGRFLAGAAREVENTDSDVIFGNFAFEYPDGRREFVSPDALYGRLDPETVLRRWLTGGYVPPCAVVWSTDYVRRLGGWDESLAKNQDGDIMYRALMREAQIATSPVGHGIYSQDDNPNRITRRHTPRTLQSQYNVLEKIRREMPDLAFDPGAELANAYYNLARLAYTVGVNDIGSQAEEQARRLGLTGQPGSLSHAVMASILGLKGKQTLARLVKQSLGR